MYSVFNDRIQLSATTQTLPGCLTGHLPLLNSSILITYECRYFFHQHQNYSLAICILIIQLISPILISSDPVFTAMSTTALTSSKLLFINYKVRCNISLWSQSKRSNISMVVLFMVVFISQTDVCVMKITHFNATLLVLFIIFCHTMLVCWLLGGWCLLGMGVHES